MGPQVPLKILRCKGSDIAYHTRTTERSNPDWPYIGLGLQHDMILYLRKNDYRCHDKRLRYYDFPELRYMKY